VRGWRVTLLHTIGPARQLVPTVLQSEYVSISLFQSYVSVPLMVHARLLITCPILKQQGMWKCLACKHFTFACVMRLATLFQLTWSHVAPVVIINAEKYFGRKNLREETTSDAYAYVGW